MMDKILVFSNALFIIAIGLVAVSSLVAGVRVLARVLTGSYAVLNEAVVVLATSLGIAFSILACLCKPLPRPSLLTVVLGSHNSALMSDLAISDGAAGVVSERFHKLSIASLTCYEAASTLAKASIILQYLRCFTSTRFAWTSRILLGVLVAGLIVSLCMAFLKCDPLLHVYREKIQRCLDLKAFWTYDGAFTVTMSLIITILPIPWMLPLTEARWHKSDIAIILSFGLCAILRMASLLEGGEPEEEVRTILIYHVWSIVEVNTALLLACAVALRNPIRNMVIKCQKPQACRKGGSKSEAPSDTPPIIVPSTSQPVPIRRSGTGPRELSHLEPRRYAHTADRPAGESTDYIYVAVGCRVVKTPKGGMVPAPQTCPTKQSEILAQDYVDNV